MSTSQVLRKQLEVVNTVIQEDDRADGGRGGAWTGRKRVGTGKRKLTTREKLERARKAEEAKQDRTLQNLRALVPAESYNLALERSGGSEAAAGKAKEEPAENVRLERSYEDAVLQRYMRGIKRLRVATPEERRKKKARREEEQLAYSVSAVNREEVPLEAYEKATKEAKLRERKAERRRKRRNTKLSNEQQAAIGD